MAADLRFLTRKGCHLCDDAIELLRGIPLTIIDIDLDPDLLLMYDERVPVVLDATGSVVAEGAITAEQALRLRNS